MMQHKVIVLFLLALAADVFASSPKGQSKVEENHSLNKTEEADELSTNNANK